MPDAAARRLSGDLQAGLTVALVGLPQCLAYALMSGLPPAYGLSTAAVAGLVAALFGKSAQVVTGPTNTTGLLILAALVPHLAPNGLLGEGGLPVLATLTLLAGMIRVVVALAGGANLIRFLPESVLVGFTAGAGLLIAAMQLDEAVGLGGVRASGLVSELRAVGSSLPGLGVPALLVTGATVAVVSLGGRRSARFPAALVAVLGAVGFAMASGLSQASGLPLVRDRAGVPSGWPAGALPSLDPGLLQQLLIPASAIVLLGSLELAVTARAGGARPDMKREILAQGWANVAGAFGASFPASASLTRSALLRVGGARTRLAAAAAALFTVPILLFGGRLVGEIPQASLAGVLFVIAFRMIDGAAMRRLWRASHETRLLLVLTFFATLLLPLEWAILLGCGTGLVIHLANTAAPRLRLLRPENGRLVPVNPGESPGSVVLEVSGDLHYAAVPPFVSEAEALLPAGVRLVVLDLSHAHEIRFTALRAFEALAAEIEAERGTLCLAGADEDVVALVKRSGSLLRVVPAEVEPGLSVQRCLDATASGPAPKAPHS
ncbi:MAG TPA: SulP family inorganic anion transporter [Vicinamibacteria bacterium]|nr:SulP family inorganic anion transporter [Vicinamibacteria bacterium]